MEVLMGIFVKACVAVAVGVICLAGLILYSRKIGKMHRTQEPADLMTQTQQKARMRQLHI
mgnify:CR=1 FL=1